MYKTNNTLYYNLIYSHLNTWLFPFICKGSRIGPWLQVHRDGNLDFQAQEAKSILLFPLLLQSRVSYTCIIPLAWSNILSSAVTKACPKHLGILFKLNKPHWPEHSLIMSVVTKYLLWSSRNCPFFPTHNHWVSLWNKKNTLSDKRMEDIFVLGQHRKKYLHIPLTMVHWSTHQCEYPVASFPFQPHCHIPKYYN